MEFRKLNYFLLACCLTSFVLMTAFYYQQKDNTLTEQEKKDGWKLLFDGETTKGWRTYQNKKEDSWEVANGELRCKQDAKNHADLITNDQYENFELAFDWKVSKASNSGLIYHVQETHDASYETGPEYQLVDDNGYPDKLEDWQKSGADYAMYSPSAFTAKPPGEYNHTQIIVNKGHVQHWLNGVKVVDFMAWTPEWEKLKMAGKWKDYPDYGKAKSGFIALQDHGGGVWFKNIKIKKL